MAILKSGARLTAPAEPDHSYLGLASRRKRKALSLETIAETTKISIRWLQAIEAGAFDKLPGGIYAKSYIRQYARAIDFDEETLLSHYFAKVGVAPASSQSTEPAREPEESMLSRLLRYPA